MRTPFSIAVTDTATGAVTFRRSDETAFMASLAGWFGENPSRLRERLEKGDTITALSRTYKRAND